MRSGDKRIEFFEVDIPRCSLTYGTAPCAAVLGTTGTHKCFNSRVTCQDPDNYTPTETVTLRFAQPQEGLLGYGLVLPMLQREPDIVEGAINLAGMEDSVSAFGSREQATIRMVDGKHSDLQLDKYRLERYTGDASLLDSGDAQAGAADTLTLKATAPESFAGTPIVRLVTGPGSVQERPVSAYDGGTKVATVSPRWRTNLLVRSEEFDNASWSKSNCSVSPNVVADPDGNITMDKLVENTANAQHLLIQSKSLSAGDTAWSIVVKAAERTKAQINRTDIGGFSARFDLSAGTVLGGSGFTSIDIEDLGGGLFRLSAILTLASSVTVSFGIQPLDAGGSASYTGDGSSGIYVGRAQIDLASALGDYIKTEAAAITLPDATTGYEVREAYDPYKRGTFIGKFLARHPYFVNYRARVRRGVIGEALDDMEVRYYVLDAINGPNNGIATFKAKDLFSKVEKRKATFPFTSLGQLNGDLTGTPATFSVEPAGIGNTLDEEGGYASITSTPGYLCIGDEVVHATRAGDTFTFVNDSKGLSRGCLGTTAEDHDDDDLVQRVGSMTGPVQDNIYDLLTQYSKLPAVNINKVLWDERAAAASMVNNYEAHVPRPEPVEKLVGELEVEAGVTVWHDTTTDMVEFRPLRPAAPVHTVRDDSWIIKGTMSSQHADSKRLSRVALYFGIKNITGEMDDEHNFHQRVLLPDLTAEDPAQYGSMSERKIFSRWIQQGGLISATQTVKRVLSIYRDPPLEAGFEVYGTREGQLQLAVPFQLDTVDVQNFVGENELVTMLPVKIGREADRIPIEAQQIRFAIDLGDPNEREIFLSNNQNNVNLRTLHDSLYVSPTGSETVTFTHNNDIIVGSSSTGLPAVDTGNWPAGVSLFYDNLGRIQGKGGAGGKGNDWNNLNGSNGSAGGLALKVRFAITIDNEFGEIWGGGGGGGAGGETHYFGVTGIGGSGGGAGQGTTVSAGGAPGQGQVPPYVGISGNANTSEAPGTGGGIVVGGGGARNGAGGTGGGPGQAGQNGQLGWWPGYPAGGSTTPTNGGAAGAAVEGDSFITWTNTGDRQGAIT